MPGDRRRLQSLGPIRKELSPVISTGGEHLVVFAGLLASSLYHASASTTEIGVALFFIVSFLCRAVLTRRPAVGHRVELFALCVVSTLCGIALLALGHSTGLFMVALAVLEAPHGLTYPLALGRSRTLLPSRSCRE